MPVPLVETFPVAFIEGYHAHVYYADSTERAIAAAIREAAQASFELVIGRWRDEPVGPHPGAMYQVAFAPEIFAELLPWLMLNRRGLTVLVHPDTGHPVPDHADFPLWLGEKLGLDIDKLSQ